MTQEIEVTNKQEEILDSTLERALKNVENYEGIKSGIIRDGALSLFHAGVQKSKIARLLINKLAKDKELSKKTGISQKLIYKVLRHPEFKALKSESHAKRRRGKGKNQNVTSSTGRTSNIPSPSCVDVLVAEVQKIRTEKPLLSNKEIRKYVSELDSVKQQFSANTLRRVWPHVLPLYEPHKQSADASIAKSSGLTQQQIDEQQLEQKLIKQIELIQEVLHWLSGMEEWERRQFEKGLPTGQAYALALRDRCRNHIKVVTKIMPESYLPTFLRCMHELTHLVQIFDEELYNEKLLREKKRDLSSA